MKFTWICRKCDKKNKAGWKQNKLVCSKCREEYSKLSIYNQLQQTKGEKLPTTGVNEC